MPLMLMLNAPFCRYMHDVIKFMLMASQDDDEVVALEACEFWSAYCETEVPAWPCCWCAGVPVCRCADVFSCACFSLRTGIC